MKTEAQKAAKAEANRRYREKKDTEKAAAALAVNADLGAKLKAEGEKPAANSIMGAFVAQETAAGRTLAPTKAARLAKEAADKAAARNARHVAAKAAPAAEMAKAAPTGKRAAILASAQAGVLPTKPDFSAETHKYYRKHLDAVEALMQAGDVDGLKAYPIEPKCSSRMAVHRYRNLAVTALEVRANMDAISPQR